MQKGEQLKERKIIVWAVASNQINKWTVSCKKIYKSQKYLDS